MKIYVVRNMYADVFGVFANKQQAQARMMSLRATGSICMQECEVQQPPTWTVWSKPNSCEAKSAGLNEDRAADFKVGLLSNRVMFVNVSANDIKEAIDVGESAFRTHQISNQQENSK